MRSIACDSKTQSVFENSQATSPLNKEEINYVTV